MRRALHVAALLATWACAAAAPPSAPPLAAQDARLVTRLAPEVLPAIVAELDSARATGLPVEPLVQKALEGTAKGAEAARIVGAVRGLRERLGIAAATLGGGADTGELVAASGALAVGVGPGTLRDVRDSGPRETLAMELIVLTDLIRRGVAETVASDLVLRLSRAGVGGASLADFRERVESDIRLGAVPAQAAAARAGFFLRGGPPRSPP